MENIRISIGTAAILGFTKLKMFATPKVAYLLTYYPGKCQANCQFCAQARESRSSNDVIARAVYPVYPLSDVISRIKSKYENGTLKRICLQTINYLGMHKDVINLIHLIKEFSNIPISVSRHPATKEELRQLANVRVDRIVIPLDAASERVFKKIKGRDVGNSYQWENYFKVFNYAKYIFNGKVGTHLIIGLGETEREAVEMIQRLNDLKIVCALFAFTPIKGTPMENHPKPSVGSYRRIQLAQYLIAKGLTHVENMQFNKNDEISSFGVNERDIKAIVEVGTPFIPCGCPDCNRPFATEAPKGVFYNFPWMPTQTEVEEIKKELVYYAC